MNTFARAVGHWVIYHNELGYHMPPGHDSPVDAWYTFWCTYQLQLALDDAKVDYGQPKTKRNIRPGRWKPPRGKDIEAVIDAHLTTWLLGEEWKQRFGDYNIDWKTNSNKNKTIVKLQTHVQGHGNSEITCDLLADLAHLLPQRWGAAA